MNDGGPAFPTTKDFYGSGMSLRAYAAIKLRVPDSGIDWLDEMIRKSLRDKSAEAAISIGKTPAEYRNGIAVAAYSLADALLIAREGAK